MESEDVFGSSLPSLFAYTPTCLPVDPGSTFTHSGLTLLSPDTSASNWTLHASSVWAASLYLADHLHDVNLSPFSRQKQVDVLELGAGSGLPGILLAKRSGPRIQVTLSDYPDQLILTTLTENVKNNNMPQSQVKVVGHAWGECTTNLGTFDIVFAADTLWNSEMHIPLCQTLSAVLRPCDSTRAYLVAGIHTGRWTIHRFLETLPTFGLTVEFIKERRVVERESEPGHPIHMISERAWMVEREQERESERGNWVVWIVVRWLGASLDISS